MYIRGKRRTRSSAGPM